MIDKSSRSSQFAVPLAGCKSFLILWTTLAVLCSPKLKQIAKRSGFGANAGRAVA